MTIWYDEDIKTELGTAAATCRPIQLPPKVILTDTLDMRRISGLAIRGNGRIFSYPAKQPQYSSTQIIWQGPPEKPMLASAGIACVFDGVSFILEKPALAVMHITNATGIAGGGKHVFTNCGFIQNPEHRRTTPAVLCGINTGDNHCDALVISSCIAVDCKVLLETRNDKSVGHMLFGNHTVRCGSIIDAQAGGKVSVFGHASVDDKCILRYAKVGGNVNDFTIMGLSVDSQAAEDFLLIDNQLGKRAVVRISGKLSGKAANPRSTLINNDIVEFDLSGLTGVKDDIAVG